MKIIGHRGAAGLALENTVESIEAARAAGVDAIEFDIRVTRDGKIVLSHDKHIGRISDYDHRISKSSLRKLRQLQLRNGKPIATLREAIVAAQRTPLVIEGKDSGWARPLAVYLGRQRNLPHISVISFNHRELYTLRTLVPSVETYAIERTKPFDVIRTARLLGFTGVDLNFWILNPLTYWLARYHKLRIIVYTVNHPVLASLLGLLYPNISITTNLPDQMQFLRKKTRQRRSH
jgi:glycerophosphoryl diester phosphodiesterase